MSIENKRLQQTDLEKTIRSFEEQLNLSIDTLKANKTSFTYSKALKSECALLIESILEIGESNKQFKPIALSTENYVLSYEWFEIAKDFMVLWRNILLEISKAYIKEREGLIDATLAEALVTASNETLSNAAQTVLKVLENRNDASYLSKIEKWKFEHNPWEVYEKQFQVIAQQCTDIAQQCVIFSSIIEHYAALKADFVAFFSSYKTNLIQLGDGIKKVHEEAVLIDDFQLGKVNNQLKNINEKAFTLKNLDTFSAETATRINYLPTETKVVMTPENGKLLYKLMDIQQTTQTWTETELMPSLYDCYTAQEIVLNQIELAKLNIKNSLNQELQAEEKEEASKLKVGSVLENLIRQIDKTSKEAEALEQHIHTQLEEMRASNIYKNDFLQLSLNPTLRQYQYYQTKGINRFRKWVENSGLYVENIKKSVQLEEELTVWEKIVRCIRQRTPDKENRHYLNMFLTKGYIGESFHIGRTEEFNKVKNVVANWDLGFRGGLMITGQALSGKTAMGTAISQEFFKQTTVSLKPNTKIMFGGRFLESTFDLKEAFSFIVKYGLQERFMIWIDDLSAWQDDKISLGENIQALNDVIDQHGNRIFVVAAMSNSLRTQLNRFYQIDKIFQSHINMDGMQWPDIKKAIITRHNATQMTLANEQKEAISNAELDKIIKKIYKITEGNIGEALHYWSFTIQKMDEEHVGFLTENYYRLPAFLTDDLAILIRTILVDKTTNEYLLTKKFGSIFKTQYRPLLLRLFQLDILQRQTNGFFNINPFIINELGEMLEQHFGFAHQNINLDKTYTQL